MKYRIVGNVMPAVEMLLDRGEKVYTQKGGMCWMSDGIDMETNTRGGLLKGLGRMFAGESVFMNTYVSRRDHTMIAFSSTVPGDIHMLDLRTEGPMICQKSAFLCAQDQVSLDTVFTKRARSAFFGGEGLILQRLSGNGIAFLEVDGNLVEKELAPGEVLKVDTGNVVAFSENVDYDIEMVQGAANIFLGGEGLFLTKLTGPGKVLLQTMNIGELAGRLSSYIITKD